MSYFDEAIKKAFPPPPPPTPYTWPKLTRDVTVTKLERTEITPAGPGKRIPIPVRVVTVKGLVTTYRFRPAPWLRIGPIRLPKPPQTHLPHSTKATPGTSPHKASKGRRAFDPYGDFNFHITIGDLGPMAFQKFEGISVEIDEIEYKDSLDTHPHKRPGIHRFGNLKFSKGVIANKKLWDWIHGVMKGDVKRMNGSIHVLNDDKNAQAPEITYNFYQAWPCKWNGLKLDGKGQGALIEDLELVVDFIARAK